jgi:hypothetical protein
MQIVLKSTTGGSNENFNDQYRSYCRIRSLDQECYLGNFDGGTYGYFAWINELVKCSGFWGMKLGQNIFMF